MPFSPTHNQVVTSPNGWGKYISAIPFDEIPRVRSPFTCEVYRADRVHATNGSFRETWLELAQSTVQQARAVMRVQAHVLNPSAESDIDSLTETVEAALEFVSEFGPGQLNLLEYTAQRVHYEHLAALLRATSTWRDSIPGWHEALREAEAATQQVGADPEDVLFGMI